jgi:hypothetical protein
LKDKYAYIYNGSKFIAVLKADILEELVDIHFENIEYSADEYKHKLQPKTIEVLEKFIDKMNNEEDEFIDQEHKLSYPNFSLSFENSPLLRRFATFSIYSGIGYLKTFKFVIISCP